MRYKRPNGCTGDRVRRKSDGTYQCLGRMDRQVKIRGHRIELGEIEENLLDVNPVRNAAVIVREDQPGDKRLTAYCVNASDVTEDSLRQSLSRKLPDYMIPARFVFLKAMPLTANSKVDRSALAALPAPEAQNTVVNFMAPETRAESILCKVFAEVLKLECVGVTDDFFTLGGDSIHVFQASARARREGLNITPKQIMQLRRVASILKASAAEATQSIQSTRITAKSRETFRSQVTR